jgi:hypothetical protein
MHKERHIKNLTSGVLQLAAALHQHLASLQCIGSTAFSGNCVTYDPSPGMCVACWPVPKSLGLTMACTAGVTGADNGVHCCCCCCLGAAQC